MYKKGDFHLHTLASDGRLTPSELVETAFKADLDIIAVTDHDTTSGVPEALEAASKFGLKVIPGMELSATHKDESIHILGYFKDDTYKNEAFQTFLKEMHAYRSWRGKRIVDNLKIYFDIDIDGDKLLRETKGVIARPHIAQAIIKAGYKYDWDFIFDTILSKDSPAYVPNKNISINEGIKILREVNALVVLAHPILVKKSTIEELIKYDFDGIEGIYALNTQEATEKFIKIATENNKFVTAGSDFHGIGNADSKHGNIADVTLIGDRLKYFVEKLNGC